MTGLTVTGEARYRTIDERQIVALLLLRGWAFELRSTDRQRAELEAAAALDRLVARGLSYTRGPEGERLFDPVEASNFMRLAGLRGEDSTLLARCAPSDRRLVLAAEADDPSAYAVTVMRRFNLAGRKPGAALRLRLPTALPDPTQTAIQTEFLPPEGTVTKVRRAPGRIEITIEIPDAPDISLGVRTTFTRRRWAADAKVLDPADADLYLRASDGLIRVDDSVRALAQRLAGRESDSWSIMGRFWALLMDELACGLVHYDRIDPADPYRTVLAEGWYDCRVGSALLAALCRARGLPARVVHGYMLYPAAPDIHTWAEVWIDGAGWLPFDLLSWNLSARAAGRSWRDYFFGRVDHRMVVERPPRQFAGTGDIRLPPAWHMLTSADEGGTAIEFVDLETNTLVYAETVRVECLGADVPELG